MSAPLPLAARVVRRLFRSRVRGSWRAADVLTRRLRSLHAFPIHFGGWPPIHVDLRDPRGRDWLARAPYAACPHEPHVQQLLRRLVRPGDTVVDVGANEGILTTLLAQQVGPTGHVHAVEPNPGLLPCLTRTVAGLGNVTLHACAAGDAHAELTLYVPIGDNSMASLTDWTSNRPTRRDGTDAVRTHRVPVVPLAELVAAQPSLLKVDVEGAEVLVLRGARSLLDRPDAPWVLFEELAEAERAHGLPPHATVEFLRGLAAPGYTFEILEDDGTLRPYASEHSGYINVLATPAGRRA